MILNNGVSELNSLKIDIGDFSVNEDELVSLEISYEGNTPVVLATLIFKDTYNFNELQDWKDCEVYVKIVDNSKKDIEKRFIITNISEQENEKKEKTFFLELQDKFSYTFEKSFHAYSFNSNPKEAITKYTSILKLEDFDIDVGDISETFDFVIPANKNNLESFLSEFKKHGFTFYQTKSGIFIKSVDDLLPSNLPSNDDEQMFFTDETANKLFINRIHNSTKQFMRRNSTPPKSRACAYDIATKTMKKYEKNDVEDFLMNDESVNLQEDLGSTFVYQQHLNFENHRLDMRDSFMNQNQIDIVVNGFIKNEIHQIYDLKFIGNKSTVKGMKNGNTIVSGKYISTRVVDKIIKKSFVQKIILKRVDMRKRIS